MFCKMVLCKTIKIKLINRIVKISIFIMAYKELVFACEVLKTHFAQPYYTMQ